MLKTFKWIFTWSTQTAFYLSHQNLHDIFFPKVMKIQLIPVLSFLHLFQIELLCNGIHIEGIEEVDALIFNVTKQHQKAEDNSTKPYHWKILFFSIFFLKPFLIIFFSILLIYASYQMTLSFAYFRLRPSQLIRRSFWFTNLKVDGKHSRLFHMGCNHSGCIFLS